MHGSVIEGSDIVQELAELNVLLHPKILIQKKSYKT